jgi:hypothetical protein
MFLSFFLVCGYFIFFFFSVLTIVFTVRLAYSERNPRIFLEGKGRPARKADPYRHL